MVSFVGERRRKTQKGTEVNKIIKYLPVPYFFIYIKRKDLIISAGQRLIKASYVISKAKSLTIVPVAILEE